MKKNLLKKAFLLLALIGGASNAWGAVNTELIDGITLPSVPEGTYTGGTDVMHNATNKAVVADGDGNSVMEAIAPGYGSPTASNFTWTNAASGGTDASWSTTSTTWDAPGGSLFVGSAAYTNSENAHYVNFARRGNLRNNRTFAYRFTNCGGVSALVKSQGTSDGAAACLAVYEVGAGSSLTHVGTASSKTNAVDIITVEDLSSSKTYVAYIYGMNGSNGELYEVAFLAPSEDSPKLSASPKSVDLDATESDVAVESSFTITGSKLTPGNYDLTIPSVDGLTVSPTSFTVAADGSVSQVVNLSYSSDENVPSNTVNITATVDELNLSVAVNYSASVDTWTLQTIDAPKTWDFSSLTGGKLYEGDDVNVEHVYANITEIVCPAAFDGTALAFTGQYPLREGKGVAQAGTLRFNTSVPGYIVVKFSDTGTSASPTAVKRYLVVNGETTEYWSSRENNSSDPEIAYDKQLNVTTGAIAVPAGDVTIAGTSALVYQKVEFTPTVSKTITEAGFATYCSQYALDFSKDEELKAYIITGNESGSKLALTQVTSVPANTGVLLEGPAAEYNIPVVASSSTDVSTNKLVGVAENTVKEANSIYVLMNEGKVGFYKNSNEFTVGANTAYLPANFAGDSARSVYFFGDDITGIDQIDNGQLTIDNSQPVKRIVNGKLVIEKNGKKFNAAGAQVK